MVRGKFFAIEGPDGSGKSTAIGPICKRLQDDGFKIFQTREPTDLDSGKLLRQRLASKKKYYATADERIQEGYEDAKYFFADRVNHNRVVIKPKLAEGFNVISDRYYLSTLAYQWNQGVLFKDLMKMRDDLLSSGSIERPDAILFFSVSLETALKRLDATAKKKEKFEERGFLSTLIEKYGILLERSGDNAIVIDAEKPLDVVIDSAYSKIKAIIEAA
jgi:dTMP kinase